MFVCVVVFEEKLIGKFRCSNDNNGAIWSMAQMGQCQSDKLFYLNSYSWSCLSLSSLIVLLQEMFDLILDDSESTILKFSMISYTDCNRQRTREGTLDGWQRITQ